MDVALFFVFLCWGTSMFLLGWFFRKQQERAGGRLRYSAPDDYRFSKRDGIRKKSKQGLDRSQHMGSQRGSHNTQDRAEVVEAIETYESHGHLPGRKLNTTPSHSTGISLDQGDSDEDIINSVRSQSQVKGSDREHVSDPLHVQSLLSGDNDERELSVGGASVRLGPEMRNSLAGAMEMMLSGVKAKTSLGESKNGKLMLHVLDQLKGRIQEGGDITGDLTEALGQLGGDEAEPENDVEDETPDAKDIKDSELILSELQRLQAQDQ
jgi:hypothetical protein